MRPCPAMDNTRDTTGGYSVFAPKRSMRHAGDGLRTDCTHIIRGQFSCGGAGTLLNRRTALVSHIAHVVCGCPEEQVIRVDARRIVARMTDKHTGGDWPVGQHPCNPVGKIRLTVETEPSVSVFGLPAGACPCPAVAGLINLRPEPLRQWGRITWHRNFSFRCSALGRLTHDSGLCNALSIA